MNQILLFYIKHNLNNRHYGNCFIKTVRTLQTVSRSPKLKVKEVGGNGFFLLLIPIGTFCLGTWQVYRRNWKLGLITELDNKTKQLPVPFPENLDDLQELEYRRVKIQGVFDHSQELYLGPRPLLVGGDISEAAGGFISSGQSGFNVITPFSLSNNKLTILVNRGWVPHKYMKPSRRQSGQISGPVELTAVVRKHEARAPFMPENLTNSSIFTYRDVVKMAEMTGSAPVFVDAVETTDGGPKGSQTRVTLRNEHLSYILTWYSLSLATSYLWFKKYRKPLG